MESLPIAVCTVTHNAAAELPDFLRSLADCRAAEVVVVDCASVDGSALVAAEHCGGLPGVRLIELGENVGFAGGMNRAIAESEAPYVLALNADTRPRPEFLEALVAALERPSAERAGAVTPRIVRLEAESPTLDACGMVLVPTWRHLDRGSGEPDDGRYARPERVFGATGAACLYRRKALEDVAVDGEVFLSEFHSFREDAELSFRLRERGWEIVYEPGARIEHRRANLPERRAAMSATVNYHSLKNRFLLRAYHQTVGNLLLTLAPTLVRDLMALVYVVLRERTSLPSLAWLWRHRGRIAERRRAIQARRSVPARDIDRWFVDRALPL